MIFKLVHNYKLIDLKHKFCIRVKYYEESQVIAEDLKYQNKKILIYFFYFVISFIRGRSYFYKIRDQYQHYYGSDIEFWRIIKNYKKLSSRLNSDSHVQIGYQWKCVRRYLE